MSNTTDNNLALLEAVARGDAPAITRLLAAGADVNAVIKPVVPEGYWRIGGDGGETPLMLAVDKGLADIVRLLLAAGADVNTREEEEGFIPSNVTVLMRAAKKGRTEAARALLEAGAQVDAADEHGTTALMLAAEHGHTDTARVLLAAGASVNAEPYGKSALMLAAQRGDTDAVRLLLDAGADINAIDGWHKTPLVHAAINLQLETLELLLERGADVNATSVKIFLSMELCTPADGNELQISDLDAADAAVQQAQQDGTTAQLLLKVVKQKCAEMQWVQIHHRLNKPAVKQ